MLKALAQFLLKKRSNAIVAALLCAALPAVFVSFSAVIVALVTLRKHAKEGAIVLCWAVLPIIAKAYVLEAYLFLALTLTGFVLTWIMAVLLLHFSSWSFLVQGAAVLGVVVVALLHASGLDLVGWWLVHLASYWQTLDSSDGGAVNQVIMDKLSVLASLATGFQTFILLAMALLKLAFARWMQAMLVNPGGLRKELYCIRLGRVCLAALVLLFAMAGSLSSLPVLDAALPLAGMYMVAGLSALHYWLAPYRYAWPALLGFYVIIVLIPYAILTPLLVGALDSVIDLRKRMSS